MNCLESLLAQPISLPWAQLRSHLPPCIELPTPPDEDEDGNELFKRLDLVTRQELEAHLQTRKNALLLDIQELQLLGELYRCAVAAGCEGNTPVFAAIERQSAPTPSITPSTPSTPSTQGVQ